MFVKLAAQEYLAQQHPDILPVVEGAGHDRGGIEEESWVRLVTFSGCSGGEAPEANPGQSVPRLSWRRLVGEPNIPRGLLGTARVQPAPRTPPSVRRQLRAASVRQVLQQRVASMAPEDVRETHLKSEVLSPPRLRKPFGTQEADRDAAAWSTAAGTFPQGRLTSALLLCSDCGHCEAPRLWLLTPRTLSRRMRFTDLNVRTSAPKCRVNHSVSDKDRKTACSRVQAREMSVLDASR